MVCFFFWKIHAYECHLLSIGLPVYCTNTFLKILFNVKTAKYSVIPAVFCKPVLQRLRGFRQCNQHNHVEIFKA